MTRQEKQRTIEEVREWLQKAKAFNKKLTKEGADMSGYDCCLNDLEHFLNFQPEI